MTEQKELYTLANVEAPSGVPPSQLEAGDELHELESTAQDQRPPRLLVDLSEIRSAFREDSEAGDIFGNLTLDDFEDLGKDNVEPEHMSLTNARGASDILTSSTNEEEGDVFGATMMPPPQSQVFVMIIKNIN